MPDPTGAERARRSRAHRRGDHTLCLASCPDRGTTGTVPAARAAVPAPAPQLPGPGPARALPAEAPAGLGVRGRRLWADLATPDRTPGELILAAEAARLADRLEQLDRILRGDVAVWASIAPVRLGDPDLAVTVDAALSHARMGATALRGLITELRASATARAARAVPGGLGPVVTPGATQADPVPVLGSVLDELAAARARRIADAQGL